MSSNAQFGRPPDPPRPITVTVAQHLSFGTFYHGATGGSITVTKAGVRSATGDVILLPGGYVNAIYEIIGNRGTYVNILYGPSTVLTGSNGGSMTLTIGPIDPFVITTNYPTPYQFPVGGTLTVGNSVANPPGAYSGSITITFNQE